MDIAAWRRTGGPRRALQAMLGKPAEEQRLAAEQRGAADHAQIAALAERLNALAESVAKLPPGVQLAELESAISRIKTLEAAQPLAADALSQAREAVERARRMAAELDAAQSVADGAHRKAQVALGEVRSAAAVTASARSQSTALAAAVAEIRAAAQRADVAAADAQQRLAAIGIYVVSVAREGRALVVTYSTGAQETIDLPDDRRLLSGGGVTYEVPSAGGGLSQAAVQALIDASLLASKQADYPIGRLYISAVNTDPATVLGFGTWAAYGSGRVPVGYNAADSDFDTAEKTGGAKTVAAAGTNSAPAFTGTPLGTHAHAVSGSTQAITAGTPAGTVAAPVFTGDAMGTHSHGVGTLAADAHAGTAVSAHAGTAVADHASHTHTTTSTVSVADHAAHTHNFTQSSNATTPDLVTALGTGAAVAAAGVTNNPNSTLTHTVTNNADVSGGPSATLTHSVTQPNNHTVTQPNNHTLSGSTAAVAAGTPTGTNSAPAFTGNALGTHQHTAGTLAADAASAGTPAGSVAAPVFTGAAGSVVQPYIVVFMFKRTA